MLVNLDSENVVFNQTSNSKGDVEFRTVFGRKKALVFRQYRGFHYVDLYDNIPGKVGKISLGLDELDFLFNIRGNLESLTGHFNKVRTLLIFYLQLCQHIVAVLNRFDVGSDTF